MIRIRFIVLAALLSCILAAGCATTTISADQVGTYTGTYITKTYSFPTGVVKPLKLPMEIVLNSDDSYTVSTGGSLVAEGTGFFGPDFGSLPLASPPRVLQITLHFKGGKIKGQYSQTVATTSGSFTEGKISLKKTTP